ncbi:hypothetical protein [Methanobrevibacter sp.]|uniref:hypothetical protein n=1 Tax=Methanobrevibacter sp. TaxID=66852 RepID=UPI00386DFBB1
MKLNKQIIIILIIIIAILSVGIAYELFKTNNTQNDVKNVTTNNTTSNTTLNATLQQTEPTISDSGKYGYCAICGKALSYSEASNEYTQGKVCAACAQNPYYQSGEGAEYANEKLFEAYPDEYAWMHEDSDS